LTLEQVNNRPGMGNERQAPRGHKDRAIKGCFKLFSGGWSDAVLSDFLNEGSMGPGPTKPAVVHGPAEIADHDGAIFAEGQSPWCCSRLRRSAQARRPKPGLLRCIGPMEQCGHWR
jgi:hypothetical protein